MLTRDEIAKAFEQINVWSRGDERAPHKPLLVLLALARLAHDKSSRIAFREVAPQLTELLKEFGPSRKTHHPEYPFWRLQNDSVWAVENADQLRRRTGQTDIPSRVLLDNDVHAGFRLEIAERLQGDPALLARVALCLLDAHFPPSVHQDILDAVGLQLERTETVTRRWRDPLFRPRILSAYGNACAVCGFDLRIGSRPFGLEAAHIKWHQAGGPDEEPNGLALCSLHHKAFDLGAFTVDQDHRLLISEHAHGQRGFNEWLLRFHGQPIFRPSQKVHQPAEPFLAWHEQQVFKRPPRQI